MPWQFWVIGASNRVFIAQSALIGDLVNITPIFTFPETFSGYPLQAGLPWFRLSDCISHILPCRVYMVIVVQYQESTLAWLWLWSPCLRQSHYIHYGRQFSGHFAVVSHESALLEGYITYWQYMFQNTYLDKGGILPPQTFHIWPG